MLHHFRKFGRRDPFEEARREMNFRLTEIQEDILRRFKAGEQREIMRRTMRELIDSQSDLQGKINKLMVFAQQIELSQFDEQDQDDFFVQSDAFRFRRQQPFQGRHLQRDFNNQSTQISRIYKDKKQIFTEKDYSDILDNRMSQSQKSFRYENNFSKNPESYSKISQQANKYPKEGSNKRSQGSILSFTEKQDAIDEQDLFSFRTQGGVSPVKNSPTIIYRDSIGSQNQSKQSLLSPKQQKSVRSNSKSKSPSKMMQSLSPKSRQVKSRKNINYDGQSLIYDVGKRSNISRLSTKDRKKNRQLSAKSISKIYSKIGKRIELSRCVVDIINHSNFVVDSAYLDNRYHHEVDVRKQLSTQIQSSLYNTSKWRY